METPPHMTHLKMIIKKPHRNICNINSHIWICRTTLPHEYNIQTSESQVALSAAIPVVLIFPYFYTLPLASGLQLILVSKSKRIFVQSALINLRYDIQYIRVSTQPLFDTRCIDKPIIGGNDIFHPWIAFAVLSLRLM